ncbi:DUF998 domain-containing protein [Dactylosporangium sp. NPDC049525]|uniref:DUF998 domain-containing protein n=1 Tax=Dactylosporangium sp. NPDC049525 TaxID=3154730 RepID=UPI003449CD21
MTTRSTPLAAPPRPAAAPPGAHLSHLSRVLALGAVAGPAVFTLAWLVLGFVSSGYTVSGTHIAPYSHVSQPISGLGMGGTAPFMNTGFVLSGLLLLAGVIGIFQGITAAGRPVARWVSTVLLALSPAGLVVVGLFDLESPALHFTGAGLIYLLPVISFPVAGHYLRRIPQWRRFGTALFLAGALTLALAVVFTMTFDVDTTAAGHGVAGLTQRVLFTEVLAWFAAMGWLARREPAARRDA